MTLQQHCSITLPHYKLSNELQKESLYSFCINDNSIMNYLPDELSMESSQRDLLISVSYAWLLLADIFSKTWLFQEVNRNIETDMFFQWKQEFTRLWNWSKSWELN